MRRARARPARSERLAVRNLMQELRSGGKLISGPPPFRESDRQLFANQAAALVHFRGNPDYRFAFAVCTMRS